METIQVPIEEYRKMQEELSLLKNSELLKNLNKLVDMLFAEKYGLYMGDFTDDLTTHAVLHHFDNDSTAWDNVYTKQSGMR
jgi:hypothetical protein